MKAVRSDTPSEVTEMIQKCWQGDPNRRPTSLGITQLFKCFFYKKSFFFTRMSINGVSEVFLFED